jgi:hypothetical protein
MKKTYIRLKEKNIQALVVIRASALPSEKCSWGNIASDIQKIALLLEEKGKAYRRSEV